MLKEGYRPPDPEPKQDSQETTQDGDYWDQYEDFTPDPWGGDKPGGGGYNNYEI